MASTNAVIAGKMPSQQLTDLDKPFFTFWHLRYNWKFLAQYSCLRHRSFQNCHKVSGNGMSQRTFIVYNSCNLYTVYCCWIVPMFPWTTTWCSMMLTGCTHTPLRLRERSVILNPSVIVWFSYCRYPQGCLSLGTINSMKGKGVPNNSGLLTQQYICVCVLFKANS